MQVNIARALTRTKKALSQLSQNDVIEAALATWCIEFLRVRKVGGLNILQIVVVSTLLLGVKTIIVETSGRKKGNAQIRQFVMSAKGPRMESMGNYGSPPTRYRQQGRNRGYRRNPN